MAVNEDCLLTRYILVCEQGLESENAGRVNFRISWTLTNYVHTKYIYISTAYRLTEDRSLSRIPDDCKNGAMITAYGALPRFD